MNDPSTGRAIFGDDDRRELHAIADPGLRLAANAVALLVENWDLDCDEAGAVCDLGSTRSLFGGDACPDEPYASEPATGFCTGFLIAPDLMVTAGHCIDRLTCPFTAFAFGFAITEAGGDAHTTGLSTYRCAEVVESVLRDDFENDGTFQDGADYAVVRLDRFVTDRAPLALRRAPAVVVGDPLVVMGHPFGLPLKVAEGAEVKSVAGTFFDANLDISGGNSGSPVLDRASLEVVGILVRGGPDLVLDLDQGCVRSARYSDAGGYLGFFSQATGAGVVPVVESCVGQAGCLPTTMTATCSPSSVLAVHEAFCRECSVDRKPVRGVERNVQKGLRLLGDGDLYLEFFDLERAEKALRRALKRLEGAAARLDRLAERGRVTPVCDWALRRVIDEALDLVRLELAVVAALG